MTKTAEYTKFVDGFIKEAELVGCDGDFLRGYIDQADEIVNIWKEAFDELAEKSGDPLYKIKVANELVYFTMRLPELEKKAFDLGSMQNQLEGYANNHSQGNGMMSGVLKQLADSLHNNPNMLRSLVSGGGAGGLIGLLLGVLTGHPMIGMMMGGLGGAGMGAYFGNQSMKEHINSSISGKPMLPTQNQNTQLSNGLGPRNESAANGPMAGSLPKPDVDKPFNTTEISIPNLPPPGQAPKLPQPQPKVT